MRDLKFVEQIGAWSDMKKEMAETIPLLRLARRQWWRGAPKLTWDAQIILVE